MDNNSDNENNNISNNSNLKNNTNPEFVIYNLNQTINEPGLVITNEQGITTDNNVATHTTFNTTQPELYDPQVSQNLIEVVDVYDDTINNQTLTDIKLYASKISCSDFHGKGTVNDYLNLFEAASKIANDTKQFQLDVDTDGFDEFGAAADQLSKLFTNFTVKLQNINIINDSAFLLSVANALKKIYNLSEVFGKFKQTVQETTKVDVPKSIKETKLVIENVMSEVNCAMRYINHFVDPTEQDNLPDSDLSQEEKNIINKAIDTINNWTTLSEQGVSIAMDNDVNVQYVKQTNLELKQKTSNLKSCTDKLLSKISKYL